MTTTSKPSVSSPTVSNPGASSTAAPTGSSVAAPSVSPKVVKKPPRVNNVAALGSHFCCGMTELGNFNYVDPPGGKKMTHYHKVGTSWSVQQNQDPTTKQDILDRMGGGYAGAYMCSTGAGQEYVEPILEEIGFRKVFTFVNPGHAKTPVNIWIYSKHEQK